MFFHPRRDPPAAAAARRRRVAADPSPADPRRHLGRRPSRFVAGFTAVVLALPRAAAQPARLGASKVSSRSHLARSARKNPPIASDVASSYRVGHP